MDSLTQAVLGAAVAEAGMGGRRLGNKAAVWGAALGTLPDLDILFFPWLDPLERLEWHRGLSHSLIFMIAASPLIGWGIRRIHRGKVEWSRAAWTVFWILFTHVLIDLFTVYGTMIFEPFSDFRLGFNNLFIIDPLFTIPILVGLGVALFLPRISRSRAWWNRSGLLLATAYVLWSFVAKALVNSEFERSLEAQGVRYEQRMTAPTPFNTILWRCVARGDDGIWVGYYSLFDRGTPVHFEYYPLRSELLADLEGSRVIERLRWFSDGFLGARMEGGEVVLSDWRFGETTVPIDSMENPDPLPFFSWKIDRTSDGSLVPVQLRIPGSRSDALRSLWQRIFERDVKPGDKT